MEKWKNKEGLKGFDFTHIPTYANVSLSAPPKGKEMKLDDLAFKVMLATRYASHALDLIHGNDKNADMCPVHEKRWSLQHILSCPVSCVQAVRSQHDQIVQHICGTMLRSHKVSKVVRERKSIEQEERQKKGLESKRADITYWIDGTQHSMDISVTTSWSERKGGRSVSDAQKRKENDYNGEKNSHIILFDTAGGVTDDAWKTLLSVGASKYDLRRIQTIIFRSTAKRYQIVLEENKNREYKNNMPSGELQLEGR